MIRLNSVIAHVDRKIFLFLVFSFRFYDLLSTDGKTTLVDKIFEHSGTKLGQKGQERAMDFNELEK